MPMIANMARRPFAISSQSLLVCAGAHNHTPSRQPPSGGGMECLGWSLAALRRPAAMQKWFVRPNRRIR
eukprot:833261-Heterocapsa_arctica.AAC.1